MAAVVAGIGQYDSKHASSADTNDLYALVAIALHDVDPFVALGTTQLLGQATEMFITSPM
jgi:hypothetical protein